MEFNYACEAPTNLELSLDQSAVNIRQDSNSWQGLRPKTASEANRPDEYLTVGFLPFECDFVSFWQ